MVGISSKELAGFPDCGDFILCRRCGARHVIRWGTQILPDGTEIETKTLGAVRCRGKLVLASLEGKRLMLKGGV